MIRSSRRTFTTATAALMLGLGWLPATRAAEPIKIGLVAALSGQSALSGEAITRGLQTAIDEINAQGGLLGGRQLVLVRRDDESNPAKGVTAARELIYREKVAVFFGGIDTPVALAIAPLANQAKVPFMNPWAAGTAITRNGADPNYVFRVSAVDELVDKGMVAYAQKTFKTTKFGLLMINNPWGESNQKGLVAALKEKGMEPASSEKFEATDVDIVPQLTRLKAAGADTIVLVANVGPAAQVVKSMDRMGWKVPVVSHWGVAGGRFTELGGPNASNVHFVQTYSFYGKLSPVGDQVVKELKAKYPDIKQPGDITPAVGVANAYDGMRLTALAIAKAGSTDGDAIRKGYYAIDTYQGLIKTYSHPFSPTQHDALSENDYVWAQFIDNRIVPVGMKP
ncbi:ethanolamine utilization protein EutN [Bordetella genomosp. 9]|uniref:Ethanolamine utilization protein EutN n=1 Tax=Bordetella genomosp. 9 TaxID=1416803 RepID=A0A261RMG1_9BORD|nr:ethanolamine utilization protein EutN [Bordetella genomosp. 9]